MATFFNYVFTEHFPTHVQLGHNLLVIGGGGKGGGRRGTPEDPPSPRPSSSQNVPAVHM